MEDADEPDEAGPGLLLNKKQLDKIANYDVGGGAIAAWEAVEYFAGLGLRNTPTWAYMFEYADEHQYCLEARVGTLRSPVVDVDGAEWWDGRLEYVADASTAASPVFRSRVDGTLYFEPAFRRGSNEELPDPKRHWGNRWLNALARPADRTTLAGGNWMPMPWAVPAAFNDDELREHATFERAFWALRMKAFRGEIEVRGRPDDETADPVMMEPEVLAHCRPAGDGSPPSALRSPQGRRWYGVNVKAGPNWGTTETPEERERRLIPLLDRIALGEVVEEQDDHYKEYMRREGGFSVRFGGTVTPAAKLMDSPVNGTFQLVQRRPGTSGQGPWLGQLVAIRLSAMFPELDARSLLNRLKKNSKKLSDALEVDTVERCRKAAIKRWGSPKNESATNR